MSQDLSAINEGTEKKENLQFFFLKKAICRSFIMFFFPSGEHFKLQVGVQEQWSLACYCFKMLFLHSLSMIICQIFIKDSSIFSFMS